MTNFFFLSFHYVFFLFPYSSSSIFFRAALKLNLFLFVSVFFFFVQTSTNVFVGYTNAALMHFATIPKVHTIARANMDSREMDENVKVVVRSINNYVVKK